MGAAMDMRAWIMVSALCGRTQLVRPLLQLVLAARFSSDQCRNPQGAVLEFSAAVFTRKFLDLSRPLNHAILVIAATMVRWIEPDCNWRVCC